MKGTEMNKTYYLDHAATSPINPRAFASYVKASTECIGNPSSPHSEGHKARQAIEDARRRIAKCMGCEPREIIFTSGGTESNNIALEILAPRMGDIHETTIITTWLEHHSAESYNSMHKWLVSDREGLISPSIWSDIITTRKTPNFHFVIQYANSDIGTIQDISGISKIKSTNELFFTDAVQAVGHIPINLRTLDKVDMLSASAHKFGGVKGVGFLFVRAGSVSRYQFHSLMYGGNQEFGYRPGTENVPAIVAMATALEDALDGIDYKIERRRSVQKRLIEGLSLIPDAELNGASDLTKRLPNNVSFSFKGIFGDTLVALLDAKYNIIVSAGAACESGNLDGNRIVKAIGKSEELAKGTIRITFGDDLVNDTDGVDYVIQSITDAVKELRKGIRF